MLEISKSDQAEGPKEEIRVYLEDNKYLTASISPKTTTIEELWETIGDALGFRVETAQNFFIFGVEEDLELLLYSDSTVAEVRKEWPSLFVKYSAKAKKPGLMATIKGNSKGRLMRDTELIGILDGPFKFVFKKTNLVPFSIERNLKNETATYLLWIQATKNVHESNYPCDVQTAISLGALELQANFGDRDGTKFNPGYMGRDILGFIPKHLRPLKKPEQWEAILYKVYDSVRGKSKVIAQMLYLQLVRQWPFYGCTFFKGRFVPSSEAFFQQHFSGDVVIGVNYIGIHLIDPLVLKVITVAFSELDEPKSDDKTFAFCRKKKGLPPEWFIFKTKQGELINDLLHDWFMFFKKEQLSIEKERKRQSGVFQKSPSDELVSEEGHNKLTRQQTKLNYLVTQPIVGSGTFSRPLPSNSELEMEPIDVEVDFKSMQLHNASVVVKDREESWGTESSSELPPYRPSGGSQVAYVEDEDSLPAYSKAQVSFVQPSSLQQGSYMQQGSFVQPSSLQQGSFMQQGSYVQQGNIDDETDDLPSYHK